MSNRDIILAVLDRLTGLTRDELGLVSGLDVGDIELALDRMVTGGEVVRVEDKAARQRKQTVHRIFLTRDCPSARLRTAARARTYQCSSTRQAELRKLWTAGDQKQAHA